MHFIIPPSESVEKALVTSAHKKDVDTLESEEGVKESGRANSPDDESGDDLRTGDIPGILQGIGSNADGSPPRLPEVPAPNAEPQGLWASKFPRGKWVTLEKARKPIHRYKKVSKSCSYLLPQDKAMPHGNNGGVAISVVSSGMSIGAGCDSGRPHVRNENELIETMHNGASVPGTLTRRRAPCPRAIQAHSVIEATPALMRL